MISGLSSTRKIQKRSATNAISISAYPSSFKGHNLRESRTERHSRVDKYADSTIGILIDRGWVNRMSIAKSLYIGLRHAFLWASYPLKLSDLRSVEGGQGRVLGCRRLMSWDPARINLDA